MTWSKINFNQAPTHSPYSYGRECDGCDPPVPPGAGDHRDHCDQPHDAAGDSLCSSRSRCGENPRSRGRGDSEIDQRRALLLAEK